MTRMKVLMEVIRYMALSSGVKVLTSAELQQLINASSNLHRKHRSRES